MTSVCIDTSRVKFRRRTAIPSKHSMIQAADFVTIALLVALEGLLSADNALVMAIMVLGLPQAQHKHALRYGLIGGFAFRFIATLLATYLIRVIWVKLAGGL